MDEFRTPKEEAERIIEKRTAYWNGFTAGTLSMAVAVWAFVVVATFIAWL